MRIQHNIMAMNAYRNYTNNVSAMKSNLEKLSSGYKINRAGDDAAGLAISEKMRAQITGLQTAQKNAKDGISLVQTAEGAMTEVHDMLNRMVELATQSANGTYDVDTDRKQMQKEVNQLLEEIDRIADSSNFNGIKLLDGTLGLNKEAVTAITDLAAAAKGADTVWSVAGSNLTVSNTHGATAAAKSVPEFTIDLKDVKFETSKTHAAFKITVGGVDITATAANATGATKTTKTAADLVTQIIAKYNGGASGDAAANLVRFGAAGSNAIYFKAEAVAGQTTQIKFSYVGVGATAAGKITKDNTTASTTGDAITAGAANSFNNAIKGATVAITAGAATDGTIVTGNHIIHGVEYKAATAKGSAVPFGATFQLTASMVASGNKIKIDNKEWTIAYSSTASSAITASTITINTEKASTDALKIKEVSRLLAGQTTDAYKITSVGSNTIHIDVKAGATASKTPKSIDDVKNAVTITKEGAAAKNAGVKLTIVADKFTEGDVISIGNGTAAKKFVYSATKTGSVADGANKGAKYFKDISTLKTAIGNDYNVATTASTIELRVKNATDKVPMILGRGLTLQIGDTSDDFNQLNVKVQDMHAKSLGIGGLSIANEVDAQAAIQKIKDAINTVSDVRGTLGATQNRLDHTINNLSVMTENIQDAESTIRDTDVAEEMMAYTKNNILIQSAQAMLAQANQVPQGVLQLLG